jgi:hypothetical protein
MFYPSQLCPPKPVYQSNNPNLADPALADPALVVNSQMPHPLQG